MSTPNTNPTNNPAAAPSDAPAAAASVVEPIPGADANTPAAAAPAAPAAPAPDATTSYTKADIDKAVAKALKDSAKQVADAEARAKLSEEERTKAEIADLQTQIKTRDARDAVNTEAAKLGVKNPGLIYKLVKDELEFSADGKVSNLAEVFDSAKTEYPDLFDNKPNQSIDAGAGTTGGGKPLTKEMLATMTPGEINALDWNVVSKILSAE